MNAPAGPLQLQQRTESTRKPRHQARHLPGEYYSSPSILAAEMDRIFMRNWLCIGREEEIASPGDFMTFSVGAEPIVLVRNAQGKVGTFMNMCLHRGVAVASGRGNTREFRCPYHAWLYDLDGKLAASPHMKSSEVDLKNCGLRSFPTQTWRGWIFMSFDNQVMPFAEFIAPYEEQLWWFRTEQCRLAERMVVDVQCNWKLLVENLIDIYHVPVLHKSSFGGFLKTKQEEVDFTILPRGGWLYDQESKPHSKKGNQLFPTLPWLEGKSPGMAPKAGIYPNINLSCRFDSLRMWQLWPNGVGKTQMHVFMLFPPATFDAPGFAENFEEYKAFVRQIISEDASMVVSLQAAAGSRFFAPGPMSHLEGAVHHIINHYLDELGPLEAQP
jgi:choline monooxygenase